VDDLNSAKVPWSLENEPTNIIFRTVKKSEGEDAWIFQWYDVNGKDSEATLTLPQSLKKAMLSNFLEEDGKTVEVQSKEVRVKTKGSGVMSLKVYF
jgi:alpha-mannosidase